VVSNILIFETELVNMSNRTWMYNGWQRGKAPSNEWVDGTNGFLNIAFSIPGVAENDTIKCPCAQCRNYFRHIRLTVEQKGGCSSIYMSNLPFIFSVSSLH